MNLRKAINTDIKASKDCAAGSIISDQHPALLERSTKEFKHGARYLVNANFVITATLKESEMGL